MKTINKFFTWLFADFLFNIYELTEAKFTLQGVPILTRNRRPVLPSINAYILTQYTGDTNIPTQVVSNSILYNFVGTYGYYNVYVLPNLPQQKINEIGAYARNLVGFGVVSSNLVRVTRKYAD